MPRKNVLEAFTFFDAADMSGDLLSDPITVRYLDSVAFNLDFTGTPTGTFTVEATIDGTNWFTLSFGTSISAAGSAGSHAVSFAQCPFDKLRIRYASTSGSGSVTGSIMAKSLGA